VILTFTRGSAVAAYLFHQGLPTSLLISDTLTATSIGIAVLEARL
jgi:hypothetical protein